MYSKLIKRAIDLILSIISITVLALPMLILAIIVKLTSKGPILFMQKRVGINKELFKMPKFRSMYTETPSEMPTHLLDDPQRWITPVGKIMRKTSLDELPQLFCILTGKMSFIGPRPALWNQDDLIAERDKYGANDVRPGLTGWAQINGRDELPIEQKAALDGEYVLKMSFLMDVKCFFGTFAAVLSSKGVVEGGTGVLEKEGKKNKHFLIFTNHSFMLWQFRRELIQDLLTRGDVTIALPFGDHVDDFENLGCKMIDLPFGRRTKNPFSELKLYFNYKKILKTQKPDVVITYSIKPNIYGGFACRRKKIPYCVNVQGLGTAFQTKGLAVLVTFMYKVALKKAKVVFFENQANADLFLERKIIPKEKICVLNGAGVNLNRFSHCEYPENEKIRFLYLGRIMREKGMDELFNAVETLKSEGLDFVLDLVGFFEDEYKEKVDSLIEKGIAVFHGFQQDPIPYYEKADCVVLPSYHEGMSNVLLEAAAVGRPLITSDISGCREAVIDGKSGFLCKVKDKDSLTEKMRNFCQLTLEERKKMGTNGRELMESKFEKSKVVNATITEILR